MFKRNKLDPVAEAMDLYNHVYSVLIGRGSEDNVALGVARQAATGYIYTYITLKGVKLK